MTPAKLHALIDMDDYAREQADRELEGKPRRRRPSQNPAADLSMLAGT